MEQPWEATHSCHFWHLPVPPLLWTPVEAHQAHWFLGAGAYGLYSAPGPPGDCLQGRGFCLFLSFLLADTRMCVTGG